jgi:hypothetical protein
MLAAAPAEAQDPPPDSVLVLLRNLQRRLDSLEQVIAELRAANRDTTGPVDELAALRAAAQAAAGDPEAQPDTASGGSRTRNLQVLNPEISVTGDVVGSFQARPPWTRIPGPRSSSPARRISPSPDSRKKRVKKKATASRLRKATCTGSGCPGASELAWESFGKK